MKMAMEAAREMGKLGLAADKQEAEIAKIYAETLEKLVAAGITSGPNALSMIEQIEGKFIDSKKQNAQEFEYDPFNGSMSPKQAQVDQPPMMSGM